MTAPELKPCPFCGGEAAFEHPIIEAVVWCRRCKAKIARASNPMIHSYEGGRDLEASGVISAWNIRADLCIRRDDPALLAVVEALRNAIDAIDAAYDGPDDDGAYSTCERAALAAMQELIWWKNG